MRSRLVRRLMVVGTLLCITLLVGTVGFALVEHYTVFDAFFAALTTTTGNPDAHHLTRGGQVFDSFLILFGVSAMFVVVGAVTQTAIELELGDVFGKRRRKRMIDSMQDHVIICGFGRVGRNASYELQAAKAPFVVIERNPERVARLTALGMLATMADATQDATLRAAGVTRARGLIAALATDADNLFTILSAKALNPQLTVVTRASEEEAGEKLRRGGADIVLPPYAMAGRQLADVLLRPKVIEFLDFARGNVGPGITMEQVCIGPKSGGEGTALDGMPALREFGGIVLGVQRRGGETLFHPAGNVRLFPGDFLILMGERAELNRLDAVLTQ